MSLRAAFAERFLHSPVAVASAPGRVNLSGEHTDYNGGLVLPMAIDRKVEIAVHPRDDRRVLLASADFGDTAEIELDSLDPGPGHWENYARGVLHGLEQSGHRLRGFEGLIRSDVPIGAGLSSSAALAVAVARAAVAMAGTAWEPVAMARLAQAAENSYAQVQCGVMDHLISVLGKAGHALRIDCRSLETRAAPIPPAAAIVVLDTATRRRLGDDYNARRRECEEAAGRLGVASLREIAPADWPAAAARLDPVARRRVEHVLAENARVEQGVEALERGDLATFGKLVSASHISLRDRFEVSTPALDAMVEIARSAPGCHGARMTGAGFGGCAVAVVEGELREAFAAFVAPRYQAATGLTPRIFSCAPSDGAQLA